MEEIRYNIGITPILETAHVNDECDIVAKNIARQIKNSLKSLSPVNLLSYINSTGFTFSGFNINPEYLKNRKTFSPESVYMFTRSDKPQIYPLYYTLFYEPAERENAACSQRIIVPDSVSVKRVKHDVQVEINMKRFINLNNEVNYLSMMATIAHELQHIFDQYVLPDRNFVTSGKDNVYYDFKDGNIFKFTDDSTESKIIDTLLYIISHDEQRGFLSEFRTYLTGIANNDNLKRQMFIDSVRNKHDHNGYPVDKRKDDFDEDILIEHIISNRFISNITRLGVFSRVFNELSQMDKNHYDYVMLIMGYYMNRHGMLRLREYKLGDSEANDMFSKENLDRMLFHHPANVIRDVPEKFIKTVEFSVSYEWERYRRLVRDEIHRHLHDIFNYKILGEHIDESDYNYLGLSKEDIADMNLQRTIILYD